MNRSAKRLAALRWFRSQGLPAIVLASDRWKYLPITLAPLVSWLAIVQWLVLCAFRMLVSDGSISEANIDELSTDALVLLLVAGIILFLSPFLALFGPWILSRFRNRWSISQQMLAGILWFFAFTLALFPPTATVLGVADVALGHHAYVNMVLIVLALVGGGFVGFDAMCWWALKQSIRELGMLTIMIVKILPVLMVAVLFCFVNAEIWKVADELTVGRTLIVVAVFSLLTFFLIAITMYEKTKDNVLRKGSEYPLDPAEVQALREKNMMPWLETEGEGVEELTSTPLRAYERLNLLMIPVVIQSIQAIIFSLLTALFFIAFGTFAISEAAATSWINHVPDYLSVGGVALPVSTVLVKVSMILGFFSGLSFAAQTATDESYRQSFLDPVLDRIKLLLVARSTYQQIHL